LFNTVCPKVVLFMG